MSATARTKELNMKPDNYFSKYKFNLPEHYIGVTSLIPVEIAYAFDMPVINLQRLYNYYLNGLKNYEVLENAKSNGFPSETCCPMRVIYGAISSGEIKPDLLVSTITTLCAQSTRLVDCLSSTQGVSMYEFPYPAKRGKDELEYFKLEIMKFIEYLSAKTNKKMDKDKLREICKKTNQCRTIAHEIALLMMPTDNKLKVTPEEFFISGGMLADFWGDVDKTLSILTEFKEVISKREKFGKVKKRILQTGGRDPFAAMNEYFDSLNAPIVYSEIVNGLSEELINTEDHDIINAIAEKYLAFSYYLSPEERMKKMLKVVNEYKIDGVLLYSQTFCARVIENVIFQKNFQKEEIPCIWVTSEIPEISGQIQTRIDAFIEML